MIQLLLNAGADCNAREPTDLRGLTALHIACKKNDHELADMLLTSGAILRAASDLGVLRESMAIIDADRLLVGAGDAVPVAGCAGRDGK